MKKKPKKNYPNQTTNKNLNNNKVEDIVLIERLALADLIKSVEILTLVIQERVKVVPLDENEEDRLKYVNKCMQTSIQSFEKYNP